MGVLLRRRSDAVPGLQRVRVFVDDAAVGEWFSPDCTFSNKNRRWVDTEFWIPSGFTAGKESIELRLERAPLGTNSWTEYAYQVFAVVPLKPSGDADADGLPDEWETSYFNSILAARPQADYDGDGMDTLTEYAAGTDPQAASSCFQMKSYGREIRFFAESNRVYDIWSSPHLVDGSWSVTQTNLHGAGEVISLPTDQTNAFYRVEVHLPYASP